MFNNSSYEVNDTMEYHCDLPPVFLRILGIPNTVHIIQGVIAILCGVIGVPMNVYLLVIIVKFKSLHQRSLILMLQIVIIEIFYHIVIPPTILSSAVTGEWLFGEMICNLSGILHDLFPAVRFYFPLVFTVDRFIYVFWPFFYAKHGKIIAWSLSCLMWVVAIARVIIPVYGALDCYTYVPVFKICTLFSGCSYACEVFAAIHFSLLCLFGTAFAFVLFITIVIKVKQVMKYQSVVSLENVKNVRRNTQMVFVRIQQNKKTLIMLLLIISVAALTPIFVFYGLALFYREPSAGIFITNMLVGRGFFNLIPVLDAIALTMHKDIRKVSLKLFKSLNSNLNHTA